MLGDEQYMAADQLDAVTALEQATVFAEVSGAVVTDAAWISAAGRAYRWLRNRDSLKAVSISLVPGEPHQEGAPVAVIDLSDVDEITFTLAGSDAKGAAVAAPADTWTWQLNDPDASGAAMTTSSDTTSATVSAGTPTPNLSISVSGAQTGLTGSEGINVVASAATAISLVPGTPEAETPAAPAEPAPAPEG